MRSKSGAGLFIIKRAEDVKSCGKDILDFFSEIAPCGVIGSFLLDKISSRNEIFAFKHHYITGALDSEILCSLFVAMREKRNITMETVNRNRGRIRENRVVPLRVMISAQSGRQYLMAYTPRFKRIRGFRIDHIASVKMDEKSSRFDELREKFRGMCPYMWGISTQNRLGERIEHVEFTVRYDNDEEHIHRRMEREKRCGRVEKIDDNTSRFSADVFDASELVPWIRTFICRITEIHFSDRYLERQFKEDLEAMYKLYGLEGGGER